MNPPKWQSHGSVMTIAPGGAFTEIVGASEKRRALMVSGDGIGNLNIGTHDQQIGTTQRGICLTATNPYVEITYEKYGSIVQQAWFGQASTGAVVIGFTEVMDT